MSLSKPAPNSSEQAAQIYHAITTTLFTTSIFPVRIELLSDAHPLPSGQYIQKDATNIYIPKRNLVKAYIYARHIFFSSANDKTKYTATYTLLLLNPEHLSAANFRRRYILGSGEEKIGLVMESMVYLESMFRSPLNRNTKSPTLWSFRKWLVKESGTFDLKDEMDIVLCAAETHLRNVYAWDYLRWLLTFKYNSDEEHYETSDSEVDVFRTCEQWCLQHPSDTSGWSFLCWLITCRPSTLSLMSLRIQQILQNVLERATTYKLRNEALWCFLRTMSRHESTSLHQKQSIELEARALFESSAGNSCSRSMRNITTWLQS